INQPDFSATILDCGNQFLRVGGAEKYIGMARQFLQYFQEGGLRIIRELASLVYNPDARLATHGIGMYPPGNVADGVNAAGVGSVEFNQVPATTLQLAGDNARQCRLACTRRPREQE